ncbi:MAG: tetratricopeptide repeat protein [Bacteroidota bacterium]
MFLKTKPKDTTYVVALNEYAFLMVQEGNVAVAKKTILQMEQLSKKFNFGPGFCKVMNMYGVIEYSNQNPEKAMVYFLKAKKLIQKYKLPKKFYQNSLNNIGIIYNQMGDRDNATKYALMLIDFQEKNKLEPFRTNPYYQIGTNLKYDKKYNEALQYYNKGLAIAVRYDDKVEMAIAENHIGNVYDDMQNVAEAIRHYESGLKYAENADYKLLQTDFLINLGRMYRKEKKYDKAEKYLLKSELICKEIGVTKPLKTAYHNIGDLYYFQKKYALSEKYYLQSLEIAKTMKDPEYSYSINQALADLNEKTGDFKKAFYYKTAADIAKDSTFKIETVKNTEDLLRKYETKKKEQEIAIQTIQISNANKQKWYLIGGILLLCIIGGLLFHQSRNRKKTNEKLQLLNEELDEANKTKTRFFSILNHDLRSPVSNLIHFLHLQKESPELLDEESKKRLENKTISGAENLLTSMEDILLWSKGQMENFKPQLKNIEINSLFEDTRKHFESEEKVSITFENPDDLSLVTDENYLKTIVRNLTGNAIKALNGTENSAINWKAWKEKETTYLSITDNGSGATQDQFKALYDENEVVGIKTGLGLHLIRDLAKAINCAISVNSKVNEGTTFTLKLK